MKLSKKKMQRIDNTLEKLFEWSHLNGYDNWLTNQLALEKEIEQGYRCETCKLVIKSVNKDEIVCKCINEKR
uniref:Uncharacterized protein ORF6 n=1 Tax=Spiroplasma virus 4 TaxID=2928746 RepID=ORF6_SPV4|nr:RecName: Full=Uncharacterized protein ORF6 [Spiroplasma phage 4]